MNTTATETRSAIPCTCAATVADLRRGQWAALFSDSTALQRIRYVDEPDRGGVRVEWDFGPRTRVHVRVMPATNRVQIAEGGA